MDKQNQRFIRFQQSRFLVEAFLSGTCYWFRRQGQILWGHKGNGMVMPQPFWHQFCKPRKFTWRTGVLISLISNIWAEELQPRRDELNGGKWPERRRLLFGSVNKWPSEKILITRGVIFRGNNHIKWWAIKLNILENLKLLINLEDWLPTISNNLVNEDPMSSIQK